MNKSELKASRYPNRVSEERELIKDILDEARFCTMAYVQDGRPHQIPTGFCRIEDRIFVHGSTKSHFLGQVLRCNEVCLSVMLFDGLVLTPSAMDHSVNYRSVVLYSGTTEVLDWEQKAEVMSVFTNKYVPGRTKELAAPSQEELGTTKVIALDLEQASAKVRTGAVGMDTSAATVWCGVVPCATSFGIPEPDANLSPSIKIPDYLTEMVVKSNGQ